MTPKRELTAAQVGGPGGRACKCSPGRTTVECPFSACPATIATSSSGALRPPSSHPPPLAPSPPLPLLLQLNALQSIAATAKAETLAACPADEVMPEVSKADGASNASDNTVELGCKVPTGARITNRQVRRCGDGWVGLLREGGRLRPRGWHTTSRAGRQQGRLQCHGEQHWAAGLADCGLRHCRCPAGHAPERPHCLHLQALNILSSPSGQRPAARHSTAKAET